MTTKAHVKDEMTHRAVSVQPQDRLFHAYALMRRTGFRHLPVVDKGELVGMLSDRDILRHGVVRNDELVISARVVADAMTHGVWTCQVGDRLGDIAQELLRRKIDALPVVDSNGAVIGIITSSDLLHYVSRVEGLLDAAAVQAARIEREE